MQNHIKMVLLVEIKPNCIIDHSTVVHKISISITSYKIQYIRQLTSFESRQRQLENEFSSHWSGHKCQSDLNQNSTQT